MVPNTAMQYEWFQLYRVLNTAILSTAKSTIQCSWFQEFYTNYFISSLLDSYKSCYISLIIQLNNSHLLAHN